MDDIYDPISGVYIQQNLETQETPETTEEIKTYSKKSGTKRRYSYDDKTIKKIKQDEESTRIEKLEIQLSKFEHWDMSNAIKYQIFAFRKKLNDYKKYRVRN